MKFVTDFSKGVLGQADSVELWEEITNHIPDSVLLKPNVKILSVACGHCTEAVAIAKRMLALGVSKENVNNSIWLIDKYIQFTNPAKVRYGFKNVITYDFLKWKTDMKFDVVVGNPPYEATGENGRKDQASNLWSKFTQKGMDLVTEDGYLSFITPASWLSPAADIGKGKSGLRFVDEYFKKLETIAINVNECARHFAVGSTFSYFVVKNTKSAKFSTKIITPSESYNIDIRKVNFLPKTMNQLAISINSKFLDSKKKFGIIGNNLPETKVDSVKEMTAEFKVPAYHTSGKGGTYWYLEKPIATAAKPKVIVSISGNYNPIYDLGGMSFTGMCVVYYLKDNDTMDSIRSFLDSKLVKFILDENKYTGWVSPVISDLPNVDKTKIWTDHELYQHFGLTQEEIEYIESTVK